MRWIKLLFISIILLFSLLTTISALLPSEVRISRAIDIHRPASEIYPLVASFENWKKWNLYMEKIDTGTFSTGRINSKVLRIKIIENKPNLILTEWKQPNGKIFVGGFNLIEHKGFTTVQWFFDFRFNWYPWEKFSSIVYDDQVGPPMQTSLQNLKSAVEQVH